MVVTIEFLERVRVVEVFAQMEKNAAAGRTPSSVPMPTPPPASLSTSSPEFAPLSPVHTNSLMDSKSFNAKSEPTSFNLTPAYAEDNRLHNANTARGLVENSMVDPRNERYMGGVTSGTLDAIRERMKSMQLAAASGNLDSEARPLMYVNDNQNQGLSGQINRESENPLQSGVLPMDERALSGLQARMERLKSGTIEPF